MKSLERFERRDSVSTDPAPRIKNIKGGIEMDAFRVMKPNAWNGKAIGVFCSGGDSQGKSRALIVWSICAVILLWFLAYFDRLIDWFTAWLIDLLLDWSIYCLIDWLIDWLITWWWFFSSRYECRGARSRTHGSLLRLPRLFYPRRLRRHGGRRQTHRGSVMGSCIGDHSEGQPESTCLDWLADVLLMRIFYRPSDWSSKLIFCIFLSYTGWHGDWKCPLCGISGPARSTGRRL